ncbi:MAG TPA: DUF433 domain-containing protein [Chthonomonadales bacterium]|nr:DUF433 domain-containing protein [Chthonomonadales bacterium]
MREEQKNGIEQVPPSDPRAELISINPERKSGMPCFAGTRVPIQDLWDYLAAGASLDEFLDSFPTVSREQAIRVIRMAGEKLLEGLPIR